MNILSARVVLRPRSLADVLDLALPFCLTNRRPLGVLALVALGPIAAVAAYLRIVRDWDWGWVWLVVVMAAFFVEGVFTLAVGELLFREQREVRARVFLARFARRLGAHLAVFVGRQVVLAGSACFLVVPFLIGPTILFVQDAMLLEGASFGKALARSRALARNRSLFCLGLWITVMVLPIVGAVLGNLIGDTVVGFVLQMGQPTGNLFTQGGSGFAVVGALLAIPLGAAMRFLGYVDLRTRKEGWDIQLRFVALAEQGAAGRQAA